MSMKQINKPKKAGQKSGQTPNQREKRSLLLPLPSLEMKMFRFCCFLHVDRQTIFCVCRVSVCFGFASTNCVFECLLDLSSKPKTNRIEIFDHENNRIRRRWTIAHHTHIKPSIELSQNLVFNCPKHFTQMYFYMPNIPNLAKGIDSGHSKFNIQIHEIDGNAHNSLSNTT